jgi:G:T-mismatch repair DNA endonuclease (very short patch repair protein)
MQRSLVPRFKYCSRECRSLSERNRVTVHCKVCGTPYEVIPSEVPKIVTCSKECRMRYSLSTIANMPRHGTKPELLFEAFAGERVKRTSDGTFFVTLKGGKAKNPDFVVRPYRERKVIEVFGDYWHQIEEEPDLIARYAEAGYRCLIIWEHEIYDGSFRDKFLRFFSC